MGSEAAKMWTAFVTSAVGLAGLFGFVVPPNTVNTTVAVGASLLPIIVAGATYLIPNKQK